MHPGEGLGETVRLAIDDEINFALAPQGDILGAVARDGLETQLRKQRAQGARDGRGVFDEFETVRAEGIFPQISHDK